jgi:hypothetical protein
MIDENQDTMKQVPSKARVPAAARSGFGRARPHSNQAQTGGDNEPKPASSPAPLFRVAGVQMASGPNLAANLNEARRLIEMAVEQGAQLVALPEWFACMGLKDTDKLALREKHGEGPIQKFLSELSRRYRIWLIGCSVPLEATERSRVKTASVAAALDPLLPEARRKESLSRKALWVLASTPGVTCVLNGMRSPVYVEDSLAVMGWEPTTGVKQVFEGMAQARQGEVEVKGWKA